MCSQNAGNVTSEPLILKIFRGASPRTHLGVTKYQSPPRQNQNSTPMLVYTQHLFIAHLALVCNFLCILALPRISQFLIENRKASMDCLEGQCKVAGKFIS